jgi:hypothetical protein
MTTQTAHHQRGGQGVWARTRSLPASLTRAARRAGAALPRGPLLPRTTTLTQRPPPRLPMTMMTSSPCATRDAEKFAPLLHVSFASRRAAACDMWLWAASRVLHPPVPYLVPKPHANHALLVAEAEAFVRKTVLTYMVNSPVLKGQTPSLPVLHGENFSHVTGVVLRCPAPAPASRAVVHARLSSAR